jgi:hypothetical protein
MKNIPAPIYKKLFMTALAGIGCMLFGLFYFIATKDHVLLLLSVALLLNCAWRAYAIYRIATKGAFDIIEGTCANIKYGIIGKLNTVFIVDDAGVETVLSLAKNCTLRIGGRYRLYFDNRNQYQTGSRFIDKALASGNFLGYEAVPVVEETTKEQTTET